MVAGGGTGSVAVQNIYTAAVVDRVYATGQTGVSDAQGGTASGSTGTSGSSSLDNASMTGATSGSATATGLIAQNNVTTRTRTDVVVQGANNGSIAIQSSNHVLVGDVGYASATSGSAQALGGNAILTNGSGLQASAASGSTAQTSLTPTNGLGAADSTSQSLSGTGLSVANTSQGSLNSTVGSSGTGGSLNVTQLGQVTITNSGGASASTSNTCGGASCAASASSRQLAADAMIAGRAGRGSAGQNLTISRAQSGVASAQGLGAQNTVNTNATVNIRIGGVNLGPINVIVQTVTNILNQGSAKAISGAASALGGLASTVGAAPGITDAAVAGSLNHPANVGTSSGNAQVLGASVVNQVNLNTAATVQVTGDNYNPIRVLVQLAVNLANSGIGAATSGDAQANGISATAQPSSFGSGGASPSNASLTTALSGSASATGLEVQNQVDLSSNVNIDIGGSNYAPISVYVLFGTQIDNSGQAIAMSGSAQSLGTPAVLSAPSGSGTTGTLAAPSGTTSTASVSAPTGTTSSGTAALSNTSLTTSQSGTAQVAGALNVVNAINQQTAVVSDPISDPSTLNRIAVNTAAISVQTSGLTSAATGGSYVGPTPVPTTASEATSGQAGHQIGLATSSISNPVNGSFGANGSVSGNVVNLSLWSALPDPGLPPMPGQIVNVSTRSLGQAAIGSDASGVAIEGRDGIPDLVPAMPGQQLPALSPAVRPSSVTSSAPQVTKPATNLVAPAPASTSNTATTIAVVAVALAALVGIAAAGWRRRAWLVDLAHSAFGLLHLS